MNICFFHENYYIGGMDTFFINLFNAWPNENDNLTLTCNYSHPGLEIIESKTTRKLTIFRYSQHYLIELIQKTIQGLTKYLDLKNDKKQHGKSKHRHQEMNQK